jgi:hypothetical protein
MEITTSKTKHNLSLYEASRWYALIDAINVVGEKCDDRQVSFDTVELKPLELLKYVNTVSDTVYNKLLQGNLL